MISNCKRYVIVFNGEIYNFEKLRLKLKKGGYIFNSASDIEVLILFKILKSIKKNLNST